MNVHKNQKRKSRKKKETKVKTNIKKNYLLLLVETMEERRRYIGVTLNISLSLSYLHESLSNYAYKEIKVT